MKFTVDGVEYSLEFQRNHKPVVIGVIGAGAEKQVIKAPSSFPYTTVVLWKRKPDCLPEIFRTATVGCWHKDRLKFSHGRGLHEQGRRHALRLLGQGLDKVLKDAMWRAYLNRKTEQKQRPTS